MDPPAGRATAAYRGRGGMGTAARRLTLPKTRPFRLGATFVPEAEPELKAGTIIGAQERYEVVRFLGQGGMGRVYEAKRVRDGQPAALKVLRNDRAVASSTELVARFRQEASAAARVGHRGIVQMYGYEQAPDGRVLLAMELLRGESLEDWMSQEGTLAQGLEYLAALCEALHAAHEAGVLHRDIKPANLYLHHEDDGSVRPTVLDFGLAKVSVPDHTQIETAAGTVLGTPYYLAPERALGKSLDRRADLYSMGVVLYELLVGSLPFEADNFMAVVEGHVRHIPLDPRQAAPERPLPDAAAMLVMKLLAKDPDERPASGLEIAEALREILRANEDLDACPTGPRAIAEPDAATQTLQGVAHDETAAESLVADPHAATLAPQLEPRGNTVVPAPLEVASPPQASRSPWLMVGLAALLTMGAVGVWAATSTGASEQAVVPPESPPTRSESAKEPAANVPSTSPERPAEPPAIVVETAVPRAREPAAEPQNEQAPDDARPSGDTTSAKRKRSRKPTPSAPEADAKSDEDAPAAKPKLPAFKDDVYAD